MTPGLWPLTRYFLRLGALGFGGPIALVGYMQRDLVERRGWVSKEEFADGLAFAQLAPGPLAAQLAIYLGWVRHGFFGATLAGVAFVAPSFLIVVVLSALYVRFGGLAWIRGAFYGIAAAVIAVIARSTARLVPMTLGRDRVLWIVFAINTVVVAWTERELVSVILASGLVILAWRGLAPVRAAAFAVAPWDLLWYFIKAGAVVFGSGLAILPYLYGGVVEQYGWLNDQQFLDAVAVSMITPGPVVITVAFIGYLTAGSVGAFAAAVGVFLPVYLAVVLGAQWFQRVKSNVRVKAFVHGITAAATGAIAGAAIVLARRAIVDLPTLAIALVALGLLYKARWIPEPALMLAAGVAGVVIAG